MNLWHHLTQLPVKPGDECISRKTGLGWKYVDATEKYLVMRNPGGLTRSLPLASALDQFGLVRDNPRAGLRVAAFEMPAERDGDAGRTILVLAAAVWVERTAEWLVLYHTSLEAGGNGELFEALKAAARGEYVWLYGTSPRPVV